MRLVDDVRQRIRDEMARQHLSQREIAQLLRWSQSRVAKILTGRIQLDVDDLEAFATILSVRPTELVRDRGLEFCADLTPTELRVLEQLRRLDAPTRDALLHLLRVTPESLETVPKRKPIIPPGRSR